MRHSKFSDGITKIDGKKYQTAKIMLPFDPYVDCPYCSLTIECSEDNELITCPHCKKTFYKEWGPQ